MNNNFSEIIKTHTNDLLPLLNHYECLPNSLKVAIKLNMDFIIENIFNITGTKLYYNNNCGINFDKYINGFNKRRIECISSLDNINIRKKYSIYIDSLNSISNTKTGVHDNILLPCIRKILLTTAYTYEQLVDLFTYADMTITSISDRIKNDNSFYYSTLSSFLLFEILPFKSNGVEAYNDFILDKKTDNENKSNYSFHCIILDMIRYIMENKIVIEIDKSIDVLASLVYILYQEMNIHSDPELIFLIFENKYGEGVTELIRAKYMGFVNKKIDFIEILDMFKSIKSDNFEKFTKYMINHKDNTINSGYNEESKTNVIDYNHTILYGNMKLSKDESFDIIKAFNQYTSDYIKKYIKKDVNLSFTLSDNNITFITYELKLPNLLLITNDGNNRYFVKYDDEIFMLFQLEGFIDAIGISINTNEDESSHFIIIQKDRNLGFRLYTDFEEIEADLEL